MHKPNKYKHIIIINIQIMNHNKVYIYVNKYIKSPKRHTVVHERGEGICVPRNNHGNPVTLL